MPFSVFRLPPARPGTRERGTRQSQTVLRRRIVQQKRYKVHKIKFHHSRDTFEEKTNLAYIVSDTWIKIEVSNEACRNTILHRMIEENVYKKAFPIQWIDT